jgi:hypothetical protein
VSISYGNAVGIATGYGLYDRGVGSSSPGRIKNFRFFMSSTHGVHPASYPVGTGALSPGVKRQGRETDHCPPTSDEVKKT